MHGTTNIFRLATYLLSTDKSALVDETITRSKSNVDTANRSNFTVDL